VIKAWIAIGRDERRCYRLVVGLTMFSSMELE
jgi:hypothetical protein